ncbi:hypothetical protein JYK22_14155, partial [Nonomuraea sp. RK-328]|nr:hypothetical protein [Nonomuraea sp. RK-328]
LPTNPSALIAPAHVALAALTTGGVFVAFPHLEGSLLPGLYPLVVAFLTGLLLAALVAAWWSLSRGHRIRAFAAT